MPDRDRHPNRASLRRISRSAACVVAMCLVPILSACGASGSPAPGPSAAAPAQFTVGVAAPIQDLDPNKALKQEQIQISDLIGGRLVTFNEDYTDVVPSLASAYETSQDGLTLTFTLADGAVFSDGSEVGPADVIASLQRQIDDKANVNAGLVANWKSLSSPDPKTVVLTLARPQPSVLTVLADPAVGFIMPAGQIKTANFFIKPVSAGQYKVESFDATNGNTTLVVNDRYRGPRGAVPTIKFSYIADANTRATQLRAGNVDLAENLPPNSLGQLSGAVKGEIVQAFGGNFLITNNKDPLLGVNNIRQALSRAIDRTQISDVVWQGGAKPLYGFWPNIGSAAGNVLPTNVDVAAAKQLLVGTPCENGCTIKLTVGPGSTTTADMATIIANNAAQIGITVEVTTPDEAAGADALGQGRYQLALIDLYDYVDRPDVLLSFGLQSDGGINALFSKYSSAEMDALIQDLVSVGGDERTAGQKKVNDLFARDMPYIPLVDRVFVNGIRTDGAQWVSFEPTGWLRVTGA